jgi:hypothetical protein
MAQSKTPEWRGKEWDSDLPLWDTDHPLHKALPNDKPVEVGSQSVTARVTAPNIDDPDLRVCIAKTAAIDLLEEASDLAPTVALEAYAVLYLHIGGNPTALKTYNASLGIKPAAQATNDFQPLLKFVAGQAWDASNKKAPARISKMASLLTYWAKYHADDPAYTPHGDGDGTSPFARWVLDDCGGYGGFANFPQPVPPPISWVEKQYEKMEDTFYDAGPASTPGELRIVGYPKEILVFQSKVAAHRTADDAAADDARCVVWLDADDPDAGLWDILEWNASEDAWEPAMSDPPMDDRKAIGERLAFEIARRAPKRSAEWYEEQYKAIPETFPKQGKHLGEYRVCGFPHPLEGDPTDETTRFGRWLDADDPAAGEWEVKCWEEAELSGRRSLGWWGVDDTLSTDLAFVKRAYAELLEETREAEREDANPDPAISPAKNGNKKPPATTPTTVPQANWLQPQPTTTHRPPPITGIGTPAGERPTIRQSEHKAELDRLRETQRRAKESRERDRQRIERDRDEYKSQSEKLQATLNVKIKGHYDFDELADILFASGDRTDALSLANRLWSLWRDDYMREQMQKADAADAEGSDDDDDAAADDNAGFDHKDNPTGSHGSAPLSKEHPTIRRLLKAIKTVLHPDTSDGETLLTIMTARKLMAAAEALVDSGWGQSIDKTDVVLKTMQAELLKAEQATA